MGICSHLPSYTSFAFANGPLGLNAIEERIMIHAADHIKWNKLEISRIAY